MTYTVEYKQVTYYQADVEADSFEEAEAIADQMDGSEFDEQPSDMGWELVSITDENGETEDYE